MKLQELGPRLTLQLVKGEEGLYEGQVLFHRYIQKTEEEREKLAKLAECKALSHLDLSYNKIRLQGAKVLADALGWDRKGGNGIGYTLLV